jgi:hypothetical protein
MSIENVLWGAPRIQGELLKLGFAEDSDESGHAFQLESGPPFRDESGHHSDLKPARRQCSLRVGGMMFWFSVGVKPVAAIVVAAGSVRGRPGSQQEGPARDAECPHG